MHAWTAYKAHAWGQDELNPISNTFSTWFNLGLTIIDSLDTIYIMNLQDIFNFMHQVQRIAARHVHLIDECQNRNLAQAAHFK